MQKTNVNLQVDKPLKKRLETYCKKKDVSVSALIRKLIRKELVNEKQSA